MTIKDLLSGKYSKFYAALIVAINTALTTYYGAEKWVMPVEMVTGAILVFLTPNIDTNQETVNNVR